uniref:GAGE domain-containing protein n=1 Tax=Equus asinus TaxID=9793 RepID=A0A9L0JHH9_EQUAS
MSGRITLTFQPRGRRDDQESSPLVGPVVAQQPGDVRPQEEEPLTESQDVAPDHEKEGEGALVVQGLALETSQELAQPKTGRERGDGPDVKGKKLPNPEPMKMPEAGEGQPQV